MSSESRRVPVESLFAATIFTPIVLSLVGSGIDAPWLRELAGKISMAVLGLLVIAAVTSSVSFRRLLADSERRQRVIQNCLRCLKDNSEYVLEFITESGEQQREVLCEVHFTRGVYVVEEIDGSSKEFDEATLVQLLLFARGDLAMRRGN